MSERERRAYNRGLEAAAMAADLFADENIRMAEDTVAHDPILNPKLRASLENQTQLDLAAMKSEGDYPVDKPWRGRGCPPKTRFYADCLAN